MANETNYAVTLPGKGTKLQMGDGATPEVFTNVAQVTRISGPSGKAGVRDVTHLGSTVKQKSGTIADWGSLTFTLLYNPADVGHTGIRDKLKAAGLVNFKLVLNDGQTTPANAIIPSIVTGWNPTGFEVDGNVEAEVELEVADDIIFDPGTP